MKIPEANAAADREWDKLEKTPAWQLTKVRNKNEVIDEARKEGKTVHFASLMDLCHLKNSELEPKFQKYNIWKSYISSNKFDAHETNICFTQLNRSWDDFSRCRFKHGWYSRSHSLGFGDWSISFRTEQNRWTQERAMEKSVGSCLAKHA